MEFRTRSLGEDEGGSSASSLSDHLERVFDNVKNDPELQKRLLAEAQNSDVDPVLLRAFFGDSLPSPDEIQQTMETDETAEMQTETRVVKEKPSPDELIGFLSEIIELKSADMTLGELQEWAEENPGVVETAIDMRL